jgi:transposase
MNSPVQYGPRIRASLIYLKDYALLPFQRSIELMQDLFGVPMSAGTLANIEQQCSAKLEATVGLIQQTVRHAEVGHFDETGMKINGKLFWLHVAGSTQASLYFPHAKRGTEAIEAMGILPGFEGTAVHDFWCSYLGYSCAHGLCNAHLVRELTFIWEECHQSWAHALSDALLGWNELVERAKHRGRTGLGGKRLGQMEQQYRKIILRGLRANPPPEETGVRKRGRKKKSKARNLVERLRDYSEWVLRFAHDFRVPFTNNLAERDLRMMKVQQKISGTFRSVEGAVAFCRIRSYIATSRKMGLNVIESLSSVFNGEPLLHRLLQTT